MAATTSAPEPVLIPYKRGPAPDPETFRLARLGALSPLALRVPVDPNKAGRTIGRLIATLKRHGYAEELIQRFLTCAGEAVPNALRYGRPGSTVSVLLILYGSGSHRCCVLSVENELNPAFPLDLPNPRRLPRFGRRTLDAINGRGFPLMREFAEDVYCLLHPDFALTTILSFAPRG